MLTGNSSDKGNMGIDRAKQSNRWLQNLFGWQKSFDDFTNFSNRVTMFSDAESLQCLSLLGWEHST